LSLTTSSVPYEAFAGGDPLWCMSARAIIALANGAAVPRRRQAGRAVASAVADPVEARSNRRMRFMDVLLHNGNSCSLTFDKGRDTEVRTPNSSMPAELFVDVLCSRYRRAKRQRG
jgi:hypothetical protein